MTFMVPDDGHLLQHTGDASLIRHYEAIAAESRAMLAAARAADWNAVERCEHRCLSLIAGLRAAFDGTPLTRAEQRQRVALLRAILVDDAEISARAEPWLAQLDALLQRPAA
jgi:hypothetical protein